MPEEFGMNRRNLLRGALGASLLYGGVGQVSADHGSGELRINNGVYDVYIGDQESDGWYFGTEEDLYSEEFAVNVGGTTQWAGSGSVVGDGFPDHGTPGTSYDVVLSITPGDAQLSVTRRVRLDETEPRLSITYEVTNESGFAIDDLRFFQYMDYDINGSGGDNGDYVTDPEHVYQRDESSGESVGFTGSRPAERYDVDEYSNVDDGINNGQLPNRDWDLQSTDDIAAALQWNFPTLADGETASPLTLYFAAGSSREEIESLLGVAVSPTASFILSDPEPGPHESITFDASGSSSPAGSIVEYAWDFDGDGTIDTQTSSPQTTHSFPTTGEYNVQLVVTDETGRSASTTQPVTIGFVNIEGLLAHYGPPRDCDGDGLFEDVNGDGTVNREDVETLQKIYLRHHFSSNMSLSPAQQAMFDFNGDGEFNFQDLIAFNQMIEAGTACGGDEGEEDDGWLDGSGWPFR